MNNFALFVLGPAGSGKTTFCKLFNDWFYVLKNGPGSKVGSCSIVNLDPASIHDDQGDGTAFDIRSQWSLTDIMDKEKLGPNGGLMKCLESVTEDWLDDNLSSKENDFLIVDCPGQVELFLHSSSLPRIIKTFENHNYTIAIIYLVDAKCLADQDIFLSAVLEAVCCMLRMKKPQLNVISKLDSYPDYDLSEENFLEKYLYSDFVDDENEQGNKQNDVCIDIKEKVIELLTDHPYFEMLPLDRCQESSLNCIFEYVNNMLQNDDVV